MTNTTTRNIPSNLPEVEFVDTDTLLYNFINDTPVS